MTQPTPDPVKVPLVIYINGKRHVVGEAVVHGEIIHTMLGNDISNEVMDQLIGRSDVAHFSLGFDEGPNPFRPTEVAATYPTQTYDELSGMGPNEWKQFVARQINNGQ